MRKEIFNVDNVSDFSNFFGLKTLHPLVNVVNMEGCTIPKLEPYTFNYSVYAVFLKDIKCGEIAYGRQSYDFQDGTIVSFAPGQVVDFFPDANVPPKGYALLFHPDFINGTSLGREIRNYSFFSYTSNEALHISESERKIILSCLENISTELQHPIDRMTKKLISSSIQLMLDYCMRFYERQFVTRHDQNSGVLAKFEHLLDEYFQTGQTQKYGLPTVRYFADKVCLSPNYFGDLIKKETGKTAQEYIQNKTIGLAKIMLLSDDKTVSEVAYDLGFQYPQHFTRLFKNYMGISPVEFRHNAS